MEEAVLETYKRAAQKREMKLCCPVDYKNKKLLDILPQEILERDYGCGDPTQFVREGEVVLDLGCGSGKHCYMIAQVVGPRGKVIGVDFNESMLGLARKYQREIAEKLGYWNTEFRKARIQNLKLDLERLDSYLRDNPIHSSDDFIKLESFITYLENNEPLIPDNSIDTVVSNCVLNLVKTEDKEILFQEIYRVLKPEGRAVISDIVSDREVPEYLRRDPELWAGCISGALREDEFLQAFLRAGFVSVRILNFEREPWKVIDGIAFRSITIEAYKGERGTCVNQGQAVIYIGPFRRVEDNEGHVFEVGKRVSVCDITFRNLQRFAKDQFIFIESSSIYLPKNGESCCVTKSCGDEFKPFRERLKEFKGALTKGKVEVLQVNTGYRCNEKCLHCHLNAGPDGSLMTEEVMEAIVEIVKRNPNLTIDITGGAPELNPHLSKFLEEISCFSKDIFLRTNLTALEKRWDLIGLFKTKGVKLVASFPHVIEEKVDFYRGKGFFKRALKVLKDLTAEGFGLEYPLYLMVNPTELALVKSKGSLEETFRDFLSKEGVAFTEIFVLNNLPLGRFKEYLLAEGKYREYNELLYKNFNEKTLNRLMCLNLLSVSPEGKLYDCDFNQALGLNIDHPEDVFALGKLGLEVLEGRPIKVGDHCYGCTALFGTGCFGALI